MPDLQADDYYLETDKLQEAQESPGPSLSERWCYNPLRPSGLGEIHAGELHEHGKHRGIDWCQAIGKCDPTDGSTTYKYDGELEHAGPFRRSTGFAASEKIDTNHKLMWNWVTYETPVEQLFQCPQVASVNITDIVKVESEYNDCLAGYFTTVTTATGDHHKFVTSSDGVVTWYEHGYLFYGDLRVA